MFYFLVRYSMHSVNLEVNMLHSETPIQMLKGGKCDRLAIPLGSNNWSTLISIES